MKQENKFFKSLLKENKISPLATAAKNDLSSI
jgi:hypothetical protein